jgi:transposase
VIQTTASRKHQSIDIGAMPLINRFIERLRLPELIDKHVPIWDKRQKLQPAVCLLVLLRNILTSRLPLYKIPDWARAFDPALLGLPGDPAQYLSDDSIGRCLDALFRSNFETLITEVVVRAVREFDIDTRQFHNDATTISFEGQYPEAIGEVRFGRETHKVTYGHHKPDGRDDMKQLLFILTTTADGFVPVWVNLDDGNAAEVNTHIRTWEALVMINGGPLFLYVSDSKLCAENNLLYIHQRHGLFLTVLPATWGEHKAFHVRLRTEVIPWQHVLTITVKREDADTEDHVKDKPKREAKDAPEDDAEEEIKDTYQGYEPAERTEQGFRILWFLSSRKAANDRAARERRIQRAEQELRELRNQIGQKYSRTTTKGKLTEAAQKILSNRKVEHLIKITVNSTKIEHPKKIGPGRKGPNSTYRMDIEEKLTLEWQLDVLELMEEAKSDGTFPLTTNDEKMSHKQALEAYKKQPRLEKRFQQLKTVFNLRPVLLQNHMRIEALLIIYFLVLLVESLIERETRNRMEERGIKHLPIYSEEKKSKSPTAGCIFQLFERLQRFRILDKDGNVAERFYGELSEPQLAVLKLHDMTADDYLTAGEVTG